MSVKSALTVTVTVAGLMGLCAPAALADTAHRPAVVKSPARVKGPAGVNSPVGVTAGPSNGGLLNVGQVNVFFGSQNTAVGNTCNNRSDSTPLTDNLLAWALDVSHDACVMAGGPNHF